MARAVVALSGGVDSAVAAALLVEQGYDVVAVMMRLWTDEERLLENRCCSAEAVEDARRVAGLLDVPFYLVNYERQFREYVVDYFLDEYSRGRTPNPCLACNRHIKFDLLLSRALALDADYLATGHYCRIRHENGRYQLLRGIDSHKDQSYVLHMLGQEQLGRVLFPLGELTKDQVRSLAAERGLPVAEKAESQDLCFVPSGDYRPFVKERRPAANAPGPVIDTAGNLIGHHYGLAGYTIGQRHGLGEEVSGRRGKTGGAVEPLFVVQTNPDANTVVVGGAAELWRSQVIVAEPTFVSGEVPPNPIRATAKVRYRSPETPCTVVPLGDGMLRVTFDSPQRAVTPGQAIAFYDGTIVLGGGVIASERRGDH